MKPHKSKILKSVTSSNGLPKCPSGTRGLDEITIGGLPRGRPTLVCGGAGCGKTLLGMEFLVRGATEFGEPGVCLSFEETEEELAGNQASLGLDVNALVARKQLAIDHIAIERRLFGETGEYDLEGLFVRPDDSGMLTGSARVEPDAKDKSAAQLALQDVERKQFLLERKRKAIGSRIAAPQLELESEVQESRQLIAEPQIKAKKWMQDQREMAKSHFVSASPLAGNGGGAKARGDCK